ncbi:MAG: tryptophan synthase subunit alpha [Chitinispirillaceae bacterium]|nr:tryptophan synthase subunit alpha [Chitinispirillaceae bacterium]
MNRYEKVFHQLRDQNEGAFIPFAVAGDPDIGASEMVLKAYIDGGADVLEIGYPFSDPIADGPVNQRGAQRAIAAGITPASFFRLMKKIRRYSDLPIGLLLYANTALHFGYRDFCSAAADAGIDSLLIADMPPEEHGELGRAMSVAGLSRVFIVSELTPPRRMRMICGEVDAFVYVVSRLGTTGTDATLSGSIRTTLSRLRSFTNKPLAVGFGISTPAHVGEVIAAGADAAIVGSALVKIIEENLDTTDVLPGLLAKKVRAYKAATSTKPYNGRSRYA